MNTRPAATTILCFGDSNTWGQRPDMPGRFTADIRWPGVLQATLGDTSYVIEEGLSSRTTDLEYSKKPGRNGKTYLTPCLVSHSPLDYVLIMLGTNDTKTEYARATPAIVNALSGLVDDVRTYGKDHDGKPPVIVLISPILINDTTPIFAKYYSEHYDHQSALKSQRFAAEIATAAKATGCLFLDASTVAKAGEDGIHLDEASHIALGKAAAELLQAAMRVQA